MASLMLSACGGGGDATTRTDTGPTPTPTGGPRTSYNVTVHSPVPLYNVKATITVAGTGVVVGSSVITNASDAVIAIPTSIIQSGVLVMITLSPVDSTSTYYDPMLNNGLGGTAPFNQTLHNFSTVYSTDVTLKVDPFSEIIYQRALVRSGTLNIAQADITRVTGLDISSASADISASFGVSSNNTFSTDFNTPAMVASNHVYLPNSGNQGVNSTVLYTIAALGQLALYAQNNTSDATPYLHFASRAAVDLLDGSLDGMTIYGGETAGTTKIASPILYTGGVAAPINSDPNRNDLADQLNDNAAVRTAYGSALKKATLQYLNTINSALSASAQMDSQSMAYLQSYNYGTFTADPNPILTTRVGAGDYTPAFGLPTGVNQKTYLNANNSVGNGQLNDIAQLNGTYTNSAGCQLNVSYDGTIQLSQGGQSYVSAITQKLSDSLTRINGTQYLLNAASSDQTAPRFIQINTNGSSVVSATTGRSTQQIPITLDTTDLSCNF